MSAPRVQPDARARGVFRFLHGVPPLRPGSVVIGLGGDVVRVLADGGAEEVSRGLVARGVMVNLRGHA